MNFRDSVAVVLVRARNPGNIGAVARAMHDFGFSRLRVVNEFAAPFEGAKSAVDAAGVMANAENFASVAEAVGDCTMVVGTTAVGERDLQHELVVLKDSAARIRGAVREPTHDGEAVMKGATEVRGAGGGRVALLFGSEKTGLSNEELSHCDWLLTIPMQEYAGLRHPSMNLGQAVAVCLYELVREGLVASQPTHDDTAVMNGARDLPTERVDAAQLERMTALLLEVMERTEYMRRHAANSSPELVRRLVRRIGVDAVDAPAWMGILRQVLWKLGEGREKADPFAALRDDK